MISLTQLYCSLIIENRGSFGTHHVIYFTLYILVSGIVE
jgi:hypothetical protein